MRSKRTRRRASSSLKRTAVHRANSSLGVGESQECVLIAIPKMMPTTQVNPKDAIRAELAISSFPPERPRRANRPAESEPNIIPTTGELDSPMTMPITSPTPAPAPRALTTPALFTMPSGYPHPALDMSKFSGHSHGFLYNHRFGP